MRRTRWVRRQISSKPKTDPESVDVDATVISVTGLRITRGDLPICKAGKKTKPCELAASRDAAMGRQKSAEGIVGLGWTGPKAQTSCKERSFHFDGRRRCRQRGKRGPNFLGEVAGRTREIIQRKHQAPRQ